MKKALFSLSFFVLVAAVAASACGPSSTGGTMAADAAISACVPDDKGCMPMGCGGRLCTPGCSYPAAPLYPTGCNFLCAGRKEEPGTEVLAGPTLSDGSDRSTCWTAVETGSPCVSGQTYQLDRDLLPGAEGLLRECVRTCLGGRLSGAFRRDGGVLCRN